MTARLAYDVHGDESAPVLVLAPSVGTTLGMWDPQLASFAEHFRVVRLAHRGHSAGLEVPPGPYTLADLAGDVLALLDSLGVDEFAWCGLSLGGMVGMWLAAHEPARISRLALCATSAYLPTGVSYRDRAATVRAEGMASVADVVVDRWFTPDFAARNPDVVEGCRAMLLAVPPEGYAGCCEAIAAMDIRADIGAITAPTLVVAGREDPATPVEQATTIVERIAGATLVVVDDAAHLVNVEKPEQCTKVLLEHLGGPA